MKVRKTLIAALEAELNNRGFAEVYSEFIDCEKCLVRGMCHKNTKLYESCEEYIDRIIKEDTSDADID